MHASALAVHEVGQLAPSQVSPGSTTPLLQLAGAIAGSNVIATLVNPPLVSPVCDCGSRSDDEREGALVVLRRRVGVRVRELHAQRVGPVGHHHAGLVEQVPGHGQRRGVVSAGRARDGIGVVPTGLADPRDQAALAGGAHRPMVFTNVPPGPSTQTATTWFGAKLPPFGVVVNVAVRVPASAREPRPPDQGGNCAGIAWWSAWARGGARTRPCDLYEACTPARLLGKSPHPVRPRCAQRP